MKLTTMTQVTVDGVMPGNGGATDEDRRSGARLFPDAGPDVALELVESRAYPRGITLQVYRPNGRPEYAPATSV